MFILFDPLWNLKSMIIIWLIGFQSTLKKDTTVFVLKIHQSIEISRLYLDLKPNKFKCYIYKLHKFADI